MSTCVCSDTQRRLIEAMQGMEIVDAHEHLLPEHVRTAMQVDVMVLFCHYTATDLLSAGMPARDYQRITDTTVPLDERWRSFKPFLSQIRYGSYARPAFTAAREFYGCDDINDETYHLISERMAAANTPGLYHRILRDRCGIRVALTQQRRLDYDLDLLVPLMPLDHFCFIESAESIEKRAAEAGMPVASLDDYLALARKELSQWKAQGMVGLKMISGPNDPPERKLAEARFGQLRASKEQQPLPQPSWAVAEPLRDYLTSEMLKLAADFDLAVAVHSGMWGDFRVLDAKHMIPVFARHPETRFDLYHMNMPNVREAGVIGKNYPNVWLNLCWSHIISPQMVRSALDEWIDMVPMNKILGFGGDYGTPVEKVYGHLLMARENIACVLARRVDDGLMGFAEAIGVAHQWLYENPKTLYRLGI